MIGGTVLETIVLPDQHKVWVNCRDTQSTSECAIYVELDDRALCIEKNDAIWWQAGTAMWTPWRNKTAGDRKMLHKLRCGIDYDIQLKIIGFSGVQRPSRFKPQT